jgi:hypothetical protein
MHFEAELAGGVALVSAGVEVRLEQAAAQPFRILG